MGFKFRKRIDFSKRTKGAIEKTEKELAKQLLLHATKLKTNTDAGKTYDDKKLKDYKASTKESRKRKGLQVSPPNLTQTGAMLKSITSKTDRGSSGKIKGRVFIKSLSTANFRRQGTSNTVTKARNVLKLGFRFFGISKKDVNKIQLAIKKTFKGNW